jgi:hypothetical protein
MGEPKDLGQQGSLPFDHIMPYRIVGQLAEWRGKVAYNSIGNISAPYYSMGRNNQSTLE